jgi:uncharacterized integral membrane protein (TIGR00698 family)
MECGRDGGDRKICGRQRRWPVGGPSKKHRAIVPVVRRPQWIPSRDEVPGLLLALCVGGAALAAARVVPPTPFLSDILLALVAGGLVLNTPLRRTIGLALPGAEREPDRYAHGLRFTGKWVLRASIILMGLKVQTQFFGLGELALIGGVIAAALPSAFFVAHAASALLGVRRPMADLLAGGTMICGASAVNAVAPLAGARRDEQGVAIGTVFAFSVVALLVYRPIAALVGLDAVHAGLWSGLAVNDLSSAIAVGKQMGEAGGVMAAASKSARVLCLAPVLVVLAIVRHAGGGARAVKKSALENVPRYLFGYLALAAVRTVGDRLWAGGTWTALLAADKLLVDLFLLSVAAAIGLHLEVKSLIGPGARALAVGGITSTWMALLTLGMIVAAARGAPAAAALAGLVALGVAFGAHRVTSAPEKARRRLRQRFDEGAPLSLGEATQLLDALEREGEVDEATRRRLLVQLHPSIGELIPARESPLHHGEGCRWLTYWEGQSGWALVAVCREAGSATPIHAHPHRMLGKSIEGSIEELRFHEADASVELVERRLLGHNELVDTDGLSTIHVVRVVGPTTAIDLQLRGPEVGRPGRRLRALEPVDLATLEVGRRVAVVDEVDDRPGHGGEGAAVGRVPR